MNKIHCIVWNDVRQAYVVASEQAATRGKPASTVKRIAGALAGALIAQAVCAAPAPNALPTGGQVMAGQAAIAQSGSAMTINQGSDKAILNWQSFNIGSSASVNFQQPNSASVALNRVIGADPSAIYGSLTANGQVYLVNPNGVLFGQGARVNVGGLVASTLAIRNEDFLAGNNRFTRDGSTGSVVNQGEINAKYVALLAPEVRNEGIIAANMGTVALAAGEAVTLGISGNALIDVQVDKATINTLVENKHLVQAEGGTVVMSAQSANNLLGQVVNSGTIEAQGLVNDGGVVRLLASGTIDHSGSINADAGANGKGGQIKLIADLTNPGSRTTVSGSISAKGGSTSGDGGFIETSGTHLKIADSARIDTSAANGKAGTWLLDPVDFTIAASGGDLTGAALGTALASNSVTIQTATGTNTATNLYGTTGTNGDIFVNDTVSWSANALTLSADRHIFINSPLNITGSGGLNLKFDQADAFIGNYFINAPVNLAATSSFTTQAGTTFPADTYTILTNQAGLQGITLNDPSVRYVLGANVTASGAWTPLGTNVNPFMGMFDGLGHAVDSITVSNAGNDYSGMFGFNGGTALVQNIGVTNATIAGTRFVGALAGDNEGTIFHSYASGTVTASTTNGTPITAIGGLVGQNNGVIDRSRSTVNVTATSDTGNTYTGGGVDGGIGGLAGISTSSVRDSYATGSVSGLRDVGGLIGWANMNVETSYATGAVTLAVGGTDRINVGGLIGHGDVMLAAGTSFWDTTTSTQANSFNGAGFGTAGGMTTANMKTAANFTSATVANGSVNPNWDPTVWTLANGSYPSLTFSTSSLVIAITLSYSNTSRNYGDTTAPTPTGSWSVTSGALQAGDALGAGSWGSALTNYLDAGTYFYDTTANLLSPSITLGAGHNLTDYAITLAHNSLTVNKKSLAIGVTKTYDGTTNLGDGTFLTLGLIGSQTLNYSGVTLSDKNVATANKYITGITLADGTNGGKASNYQVQLDTSNTGATINPVPLTATITAVGKVYDGTTTATPTFTINTAGFVGTETVTASGTATFDNKNMGTGKIVTARSASLVDGTHGGLASNYTLDILGIPTTTANITSRPLTLTTNDVTFESGSVWPPTYTVTPVGMINGDTLANIGLVPPTLTYTTTATQNSAVGSYLITVSGPSFTVYNNYQLSYTSTGQLNITTATNADTIVAALLDIGTGIRNNSTNWIVSKFIERAKAKGQIDTGSEGLSAYFAGISLTAHTIYSSRMSDSDKQIGSNMFISEKTGKPMTTEEVSAGMIKLIAELCPLCAPVSPIELFASELRYGFPGDK